MSDAQSNWPEAVAAANQSFRQQHPGVDVNVRFRLGRLQDEVRGDAGGGQLARRDRVRQHGHAEVHGGRGARAATSGLPQLVDLALGLAKAGVYNGRTFAVPYYAGARGVIYRTDQYKAAGIASTPKSLAEFMSAGNKLMAKYGGSKDPTYSALYYPGRYWHAAMSFVYDFGGQIARTQGGKWVGSARLAAVASGPDRLEADGPAALEGEQDR